MDFITGKCLKNVLTIHGLISRHEGGMPWFHQTLKVADLVPENLKKNHVGKVIEEEGLVRWKRSRYIDRH